MEQYPTRNGFFLPTLTSLLEMAVQYRTVKIVECLLKAGANPNIVSYLNDMDSVPIYTAIINSQYADSP